MSSQTLINRSLWIGLIIIWLSHSLQIFVPETGFDALWYHLPIAKAIVENGGLIYLPELYQSVNPLFADLFFAFGLMIAGDLGTKIVAFAFGIGLIIASYHLAKLFLTKNWALLCVLVISTFQVISWQSASFYVDVAKAFFEIVSLIYLFKYHRQPKNTWFIYSALFFSASLASKLFSLFLLPIMICLVYLILPKNKVKMTSFYLLLTLILPLPFYIFAYQHTGNPFYSFSVHADKLYEIGGQADSINYLRERLRYLPTSLIELTIAKDYTTILYLVFLPLIYFYKKTLTHPRVFILFLFSVFQFLLWWFLPPASTRYALSGFITLLIVYFLIFSYAIKKNSRMALPILLSVFLAILINFAPRVWVNFRSLKYIAGRQSKAEYLYQFYDGSIDKNIKRWHFRATP